MTVDQFVAAGKLLYGDSWQAGLSTNLQVSDRTLRRWIAKKDTLLPIWVGADVIKLLNVHGLKINSLLEDILK